MGIGAFEPVDAPKHLAGPFGLLAAATELVAPGPQGEGSVPGPDPEKWSNGVAFDPEPCVLPDPAGLLCAEEDVSGPGVAPDLVEWEAFRVYGFDPCTSTADLERDRAGIATRNLDATASYQAEEEFMWLTATGGTPFENPGLISARVPDEVAAGAWRDVLDVVDARLYTGLGGRLGMVHCDPVIAALALDHGTFKRDGKYVRTALGHTVSVGSGYAAGVPLYESDGTEIGSPTPVVPSYASPPFGLVFGTPQVYYYRGQVVTTGLDMVAVSRRTNDINVRAEQTIVLYMEDCYRIRGEANFGFTGFTLTRP